MEVCVKWYYDDSVLVDTVVNFQKAKGYVDVLFYYYFYRKLLEYPRTVGYSGKFPELGGTVVFCLFFYIYFIHDFLLFGVMVSDARPRGDS